MKSSKKVFRHGKTLHDQLKKAGMRNAQKRLKYAGTGRKQIGYLGGSNSQLARLGERKISTMNEFMPQVQKYLPKIMSKMPRERINKYGQKLSKKLGSQYPMTNSDLWKQREVTDKMKKLMTTSFKRRGKFDSMKGFSSWKQRAATRFRNKRFYRKSKRRNTNLETNLENNNEFTYSQPSLEYGGGREDVGSGVGMDSSGTTYELSLIHI